MLESGERFGNPDVNNTENIKSGTNKSAIVNGMPIIGSVVKKHDVVIGKLSEIVQTSDMRGARAKKGYLYVDTSLLYESNEEATVMDVVQADNQDGNRICKVKLSMPRTLGVGDKFSSRHGQKGMTGGGYSAGKMPFTSGGIVIDFILNVHAIPTRMTISQLLEGLFAKSHAWKGTCGDATIFRDADDTQAAKVLQSLGFDKYGTERMFIGHTGEWIDVPMFCTPVFYQRLQKFVKEEVYSVSTGPTCMITRQPLEGKGNKGGLRIGEMEKDVIISHGAGHFIMEKFRDDSDNFDIYVCRNCGQMPIVNEMKNIAICKVCKSNGMEPQIVKTRSTWSSKLFLQELQTMSIGHKLQVMPFKYEFPSKK
jgi:DNA-directed RNA polymerase II subunit RPB2